MQHQGLKRLDGLQDEFRGQVEALLDRLAVEGRYVCIVSGLRTIREQDKLYAQGRTAPGSIVTNAKGGSSAHNFARAVDLCPLDSHGALNWNDRETYKRIGALAEELGLLWGGHFKSLVDMPHVESLDWKVTQAAWRNGKIDIA